MLPYFQSLGERIEKKWVQCSYDEDSFPEIAGEALQHDPIGQIQVADIVDWVLGPAQVVRQPQHTHLFGEPPVLLFQASRFYIEALFWFSGTTSIHEHSFSGVFSVLAGSSVHSHWHFLSKRVINSRIICGRLERVCTEILRPGDWRPILAGDRLIHQLFHLDLPSVTIVIRTCGERHHLPQYTYLPPGLALDREDRDELRTRRLLLLDGMARGYMDGLWSFSRQLVEGDDLETVFYVFSALTLRKIERSLLEDLYGIAHEKHGEIVNLFRKVCDEERRTRIVTALRSKVHDPEGRFLLALLMLMPDRDAIFETIRIQFPEIEPLVAIESWLKNISGRETIGFDLNDANRLIFRGLVEGLDAECLLQRLAGIFRVDSGTKYRDQLLEQAKKIAKSDLLLPLFSESPIRRYMMV